MTTVNIPLPDQLAQEAERAGLLSSESLAGMLRAQLREKRVDQLFHSMGKMDRDSETPSMSHEEVAEEASTMRAERRRQG